MSVEEELVLEREKNKKLQMELQFYQRFDAVSGLYNRVTFYSQTKTMLMENCEKRFVMLRMDIERFKVINELWGRAEGDHLLRYIGNMLRSALCSKSNVTFGRTEADIFYICFLYTEKAVNDMISYIEKILEEYKVDFRIVPYFGLYIIVNHDMPINLMCDRTNLAIRTIKGNYMKRVAYYDDNLRKTMLWEQEIINQMGNALSNEEFQIYLQPKCDIQSGRPVGAEALVRWSHPERGVLSPADFIPIFEKNRFIIKLDFYVWEQTCMLLRRWIDEGKRPHPISVNVSRINLHNPKLCDILIELIETYQIPPSLLELEITESAYVDNQKRLVGVIENLQAYGFVVLMDDFGSGYSSLNMLKEAVVDILKLDLVFLTGDDKQNRGGNILASVMNMAGWLNLSVIAEGVETKEQAEFLRSIGCQVAQGYYYAKPMPIKDYETYLLQGADNSSRLYTAKA
ncbi:MAG: putative bifunctional diguanylate cyclase/phosphodiesterase [Velocimicrobium sp.]